MGSQVDRMGRPAINTVFNSGADKNAFNHGEPKDDFADFLHENATYRLGDLRDRRGFWNFVEPHHPGYADLPDDEEVSVYPRQFIRPIVVGGVGQVPHLHGWNAVADVQVSIDDWR